MLKYLLFAFLLIPTFVQAKELDVKLDTDWLLSIWLLEASNCANNKECEWVEAYASVIAAHGLCVNEFTGVFQKGVTGNHGTAFCLESMPDPRTNK
jgi:hypothetical protein